MHFLALIDSPWNDDSYSTGVIEKSEGFWKISRLRAPMVLGQSTFFVCRIV